MTNGVNLLHLTLWGGDIPLCLLWLLISSDSRDSGGETIDPSEMFFGGTVIYDSGYKKKPTTKKQVCIQTIEVPTVAALSSASRTCSSSDWELRPRSFGLGGG